MLVLVALCAAALAAAVPQAQAGPGRLGIDVSEAAWSDTPAEALEVPGGVVD